MVRRERDAFPSIRAERDKPWMSRREDSRAPKIARLHGEGSLLARAFPEDGGHDAAIRPTWVMLLAISSR